MQWFNHNLKDRSYSNTYDFKLSFNQSKAFNLPFHQACLDFASKLYDEHKDLVVSYSGGLDSEYILKLLSELGITYKTAILKTEFNPIEFEYAEKYCTSNGIKFDVIELNAHQFFEKMYYKTYDKGLYSMLGGVPAIVHDYYGGKVITGNAPPFYHPTEESMRLPLPSTLEFCEWDFYEYDGNVIQFFNHDANVMHSMVVETDFGLPMQYAKAKLYGLEYRPKLYYTDRFYAINNGLRPFDFEYNQLIERDEFLKIFTPTDML